MVREIRPRSTYHQNKQQIMPPTVRYNLPSPPAPPPLYSAPPIHTTIALYTAIFRYSLVSRTSSRFLVCYYYMILPQPPRTTDKKTWWAHTTYTPTFLHLHAKKKKKDNRERSKKKKRFPQLRPTTTVDNNSNKITRPALKDWRWNSELSPHTLLSSFYPRFFYRQAFSIVS